jgi:hypothetical protein
MEMGMSSVQKKIGTGEVIASLSMSTNDNLIQLKQA